MAHRKFYIRKSQNDLLQEHFQLIASVLQRSVEIPKSKRYEPAVAVNEPEISSVVEEEEVAAYIPCVPKNTVALSLSTSRTKIDDEDVQKLKKIRADATKVF